VKLPFATAAISALLLSTACGSAGSAPAASPAAAASTAQSSRAQGSPAQGSATTAGPGSADPLAQLKAAAQKEGQVNWSVAGDFANGVPQLQALIKSKYGVDLKINPDPSVDFVAVAAKAIQEIQSGAPGTYDLISQSDSTLSPWLASSHPAKVVDWQQYIPNLPAAAVVKDILLVNYDTFLVPAAFNTKVIPAAQAPKSYDDLLDPKWKGKISVHNTTTLWTWLAQPGQWGEAKLKDYLTKLAVNMGERGTYTDRYGRMVSGEYPIATTLPTNFVWQGQARKEPVDTNPSPPIRDGQYGDLIPTNVQHPNAAILLALAMVTPEGQAIRLKESNEDAGWLQGTTSAKFKAGHPTVPVDIDWQAANQGTLAKTLDAILRPS